jgi:protein-tyrosine phosphatase
MIDLHCHLLPGIDDGAPDVATSLRMAQVLVKDGVEAVVSTPHILPGLYHNRGPQIRAAVAELRSCLSDSGFRLEIYAGADAYITVDFTARLKSGDILTLADSRYVLIELPQHVGPKLVKQFFFQLLVNGYVPILTHPERLTWIDEQYDVIESLVHSGVWLQLTAGSLLGEFGKAAKYWAERILDDGIAHILATDAHNVTSRPPNLGKGRDAAAKRVGGREADDLVINRPRAVIRNEGPSSFPIPSALTPYVDFKSV